MQKILLFLVFKKNWKLTGCIYVYKKNQNDILLPHSNDSHQCPILAADFVIFYYGTEYEEAIQAGAGSE